jgi:hypothetical protein
MTKQPYQTRSGKTQYKPVMTSSEYADEHENNTGFCLACGETADSVEPDARAYPCESCGQRKVFGLEELMLMNLLIVEAHP